MIRILYIDDDVRLRETMSAYLGWYGLSVDQLGDTSGAMSALAGGRYDVLVCDVFARPFDGYELSGRIKASQDPSIRNTEILLVGPEEPDFERYVALKKSGVHSMVKYKSAEEWYEKIDIIVQKRSADRS